MSDTSELGVLYTEHSALRAASPVASLWSYETCARGRSRRDVVLNSEGNHEYWLDRSDPLLNTILPGTGVSVIVNCGDSWAAGRSLAASELLPRMSVVGPVTQARILRLGKSVCAIGAGFLPMLTPAVFRVPASELVDRIVPLEDLWGRDESERLFDRTYRASGSSSVVSILKDELMARIVRADVEPTIGQTAPRVISRRAGQVSIEKMARSYGISRQEFSRRFAAAAGVPPKLFARIARFQSLVHTLLSTDVTAWASASPAAGFYDQAHMINEFSSFAGSSPTVFFQPRGGGASTATGQLRGRPSEWVRR